MKSEKLKVKSGEAYLHFSIVPALKNQRVRFIAGFAEMSQMSYFMKSWHFGAIGRCGSVLQFFSPPQYSSRLKFWKLDTGKAFANKQNKAAVRSVSDGF
ncbi:MAG: hypothetical protein FWC50_02930 [Planctomycetaceae bacterium]|nr:hypothetical protein [Planctomycetaceae bacterium]